jgi:hypothetical protein
MEGPEDVAIEEKDGELDQKERHKVARRRYD